MKIFKKIYVSKKNEREKIKNKFIKLVIKN